MGGNQNLSIKEGQTLKINLSYCIIYPGLFKKFSYGKKNQINKSVKNLFWPLYFNASTPLKYCPSNKQTAILIFNSMCNEDIFYLQTYQFIMILQYSFCPILRYHRFYGCTYSHVIIHFNQFW